MSKDRKLLVIVTLASVFTISAIIIKYESEKRQQTTVAAVNSAAAGPQQDEHALIAMIKALPEYQGDSISINDEGKLRSHNGLIQSVIDQMYGVEGNMQYILGEARKYRKPIPYYVYKTAILHYTRQYGEENKNKPSTP